MMDDDVAPDLVLMDIVSTTDSSNCFGLTPVATLAGNAGEGWEDCLPGVARERGAVGTCQTPGNCSVRLTLISTDKDMLTFVVGLATHAKNRYKTA